MDRRTAIIAGAIALAGTALLAVLINFALEAPESRDRKLARIDIADLRPGQFRAVDTGSLRVFVIRRARQLHVVAAPLIDGAVPLPGNHWWEPALHCKNFGLDATDTVLDEARFRCRDASDLTRWQWDISGRHIGSGDARIDDMYRVKFERDGDEIVLLGLEVD